MKKHIIGLALFSFIVSAATVIYALFNVPETITVSAPQYIPAQNSYCKKKRAAKKSEINSIEIKQAVINVRTEELNWEIIAPEVDAQVVLYFFSKDRKGTHYLSSSLVIPEFSRTGKLKINKPFKFLYESKSYNNLYVIAKFVSESEIYDQSNPPEFDEAKATAVTVDYGE